MMQSPTDDFQTNTSFIKHEPFSFSVSFSPLHRVDLLRFYGPDLVVLYFSGLHYPDNYPFVVWMSLTSFEPVLEMWFLVPRSGRTSRTLGSEIPTGECPHNSLLTLSHLPFTVNTHTPTPLGSLPALTGPFRRPFASPLRLTYPLPDANA